MSGASMKCINLPTAPEPTLPAYKKPEMEVTPQMRRIEVPSVYNPQPPIPKPRKMPKEKERKLKKPQQRKPRKNAGFWTPENEEKLIQMYKAGVMYDEMAKTFGKSLSGIAARITKLADQGRLEHRLRVSSWTEIELETMKKLRDEGKTFGVIGEELHRSEKACAEMYRRKYG